VLLLWLAASMAHGAEPAKPVAADHAAKMQEALTLYRQTVRPALLAHCTECHSGATPKAGFDMSTRESLADSGMLSDTAEESYLYLSVAHLEEPFMPHKREKLPKETIEVIARWINLGAPYDGPLIEVGEIARADKQISDAERSFWSFQPLAQNEPPEVGDNTWAQTPVDRFILATLREKGLSPNPLADKRTLVRRLYLDLIGLPPSPEQVEKFLADGDGVYERLVDKLLASPHFGERWARHWLDVVRFAESDGFEHDSDRANAYHYRDFVIRALNDDLPFDTFVRWQLAGDEIAPENPLAWMATGFLAAGVFPTQITEAEFERTRYDQLDDMTATTGVAFLGLTVGCARCHDHKYDPIRAEDYYQLLSSFGKTVRSEIQLDLSSLGNERTAGEPVTVQVGSEGTPPLKSHADDRGYPHFYADTYILERGDPEQKREIAAQSFLPVLMRNNKSAGHWCDKPPDGVAKSFRRRNLANWLTDQENGAGQLLARVIVNRIWQHYFGRGIVATPNDFGMQGERPTHPELLDWLARELIRNGWRLKPIHKLIVTSNVYRQSSTFDDTDATIDPDNRFIWRFEPRRLESEAVRDCLLSCGGLLDLAMFGPGSLDEAMRRRSIYFTVKRSRMISSMQLLDMPESLVSIGARTSTTTAPQALLFMNSPLVRSAAEGFAARLEEPAKRSSEHAVQTAFMIALGRQASAEECRLWQRMIEEDVAEYEASGRADCRRLALTNFCQMLLSTNEFIYVE
jgi:hypothetical protein